MKKTIYFTSKYTPHKDRNPSHTYVSFQYNTETLELKLVHEFDGKRYELPLTNSSSSEGDDSGNQDNP